MLHTPVPLSIWAASEIGLFPINMSHPWDFLKSLITSDSLNLCRSWTYSLLSCSCHEIIACVLQDVLFTFQYAFVCGAWVLSTLSPFISLCFSSLLPPLHFQPNSSCLWQFLQVSLKSVNCICLLVAWKWRLKIPYNVFHCPFVVFCNLEEKNKVLLYSLLWMRTVV